MTRIGRYLLGTLMLAPLLAGCGDTVTPTAVTGAATATAPAAAPAAGATRRAPTAVPTGVGTAAPLPNAVQTGVPANGSPAPNLPAPVPSAVPQGSAPGGEQARLLTASQAKAWLGDARLRVVDVGSSAEYQAGHLPGAVRIDWSELASPDTSAAGISAWQGKMAALLGARGISNDSRVLIYDHGTLYGARLYWVLQQLGHSDMAILDGGFAAWQAAGGTVATAATTPVAVTYTPYPRAAVLASKAEVQAALGQKSLRLVDARSPAEYAAGHIPGAVNIPFDSTAAGTPAQVKSPADLRALFTAKGIADTDSVVTYCATGVRGAVDYFALLRAGFPNVRLYTGSWNEWSADPAAPVEK